MSAAAERNTETGHEPTVNKVHAGLTELQRDVLRFERQNFSSVGAKDEAIRARFALPAARYYQVLNGTLEEPAALVFDPMLINRLIRLRETRTTARQARAYGDHDRHISSN